MKRPRVLLIGWDAADWRVINPLMDKGEMPHLARLIEQGVMGNLMTLQPPLSPMLWNSIASGKRADQHGILGFTTIDEATGKTRPFGTMDRQVKAVWNILHQKGYTPHVVNWFCGHPAEPLRGSDTTELVIRQAANSDARKTIPDLPKDAVYPESLREQIAALRVWPHDIDAATIRLFVPRFMEVDQEKDHRLEAIAKQLAACLTNHAITTWLMENQPWDLIASYFGEIDHFGHGFMKYHPPRRPQIPEKDFELYQDVVNSAYRLHDLMLGRYLQLIDDDTTIILCSDHGFHADHLRPASIPRTPAGPAEEHRAIGILAMAGPGIRRDELVHGANLLDIAPTLLTLFGLPVGEDMEGRVLTEAFEQPPEISTIPTWETVPGEAGLIDREHKLSEHESADLVRQFVELGYIEEPVGDNDRQAAVTKAEVKWNLARVYIEKRSLTKALPLLEEVYETFPLRFDVGLRLAECLCTLGLAEEGREVARNLAAAYPNRPWAWMVEGLAELALRNRERALELFRKVEEADPAMQGLNLRLGRTYLALRQFDDARAAFQRGLDGDPDNPALLEGMAACALGRKDYEQVAHYSLDALGAEFARPISHFRLGLSLARMGQFDEAIQSLETCLRYAPDMAMAVRVAGILYERTGQQDKREQAAAELARIRELRLRRRDYLDVIRKETAARKLKRIQQARDESEDLAADIAAEMARPAPSLREPGQAGKAKPGSSGKEFVIVSGLPRSGTSLMMQMLVRGGMTPMTDGERVADVDNPEGYLEWEAVKQLARQPDIIEQAGGKVVKVISMLLGKLPPIHRYKVIFMQRPPAEVAASQARMRTRLTGRDVSAQIDQMQRSLERHQTNVLAQLEAVPHIDVLTIPYPELVADPAAFIPQLTEFLGSDRLPNAAAMAGAVRSDLYRNVGQA
jgi:predicted AlkP superfamily phosphohydrolase/phosphomutase/tetratricopeptide (TPR) repeat protein